MQATVSGFDVASRSGRVLTDDGAELVITIPPLETARPVSDAEGVAARPWASSRAAWARPG